MKLFTSAVFLLCFSFSSLAQVPSKEEIQKLINQAQKIEEQAKNAKNKQIAKNNLPVARSGNVDTSNSFTANSFVIYCNTWKTKWMAKMLRLDEKSKIKSQITLLSQSEPFRTNDILDESSAGAIMVAGRDYANLGVYFIFDAGWIGLPDKSS